jgi:hypothetical protein
MKRSSPFGSQCGAYSNAPTAPSNLPCRSVKSGCVMFIGNSRPIPRFTNLHHCQPPSPRYSARMKDELTNIVLRAIERAPHWIRRDLESKDSVVRIQAEESLAVMIAEAIRTTEGDAPE